MNQINLIGNLCKDPELNKTKDDKFVASVAIGVTSRRKKDDGSYESDFFDLKFFNDQAEMIAKYGRKGDKIFVSGRLNIRKYTDKDNIERKAIEVAVNSVELLSPKGDRAEKPATPAEPAGQNLQDVDLPDDDLPF